MPGHQSERWYGSATNDQTSSTGASRTRSAAYRGKELLAAEHPLELGLPFVLVQHVDPRVRRVARDLLHAEVAGGGRGRLPPGREPASTAPPRRRPPYPRARVLRPSP